MTVLLAGNDPLLAVLDYNNIDAASQAHIDALIEVASDIIERICHREFTKGTKTEILDGSGYREITLRHKPITSITSITFTSFVDGSTETIAGSHFTYEPKTGILRWAYASDSDSEFKDWFEEGFQNLTITYVGGFDPIPSPIKLLVAQSVLASYKPDATGTNLKKQKIGDYFYELSAQHIEENIMRSKAILSLYRNRY